MFANTLINSHPHLYRSYNLEHCYRHYEPQCLKHPTLFLQKTCFLTLVMEYVLLLQNIFLRQEYI